MVNNFLIFLLVALSGSVWADNSTDPEISENIGGFPSGTLVWTPSGKVPIQRLKENSLVMSFDLETGLINQEKVTRTLRYQQSGFWELKIGSDRLTLNPDHKFYNPDNDNWVEAKYIEVGDRVLSKDGTEKEVLSSKAIRGNKVMYEISVANAHNYFVGEEATLVHNFAFAVPVVTWVIGEGVVWASAATLAIAASAYIWASQEGTPRCNKAQNKIFADATVGLTKDEKRRVHDEVSGCNYGYHEIKQIAQEIKASRRRG